MITEEQKKSILITSLLLTVAIFGIGFLLTYSLDYFRIDSILSTIKKHEINTQSYIIEQEFIKYFGGDRCDIMSKRIVQLKEEIHKVGNDLTNYGSKSIFKKKEFDYLKRKYFLLELNFYTLLNEINKNCGQKYTPLLFFYKLEDDYSERQGYVLQEFGKEYEKELVILSFDKDYEEEPSLKLLKLRFNITRAPAIVIDNKIKLEGVYYTGQLSSVIRETLHPVDSYAKGYDFEYVLKAAGMSKDKIIQNLSSLLKTNITSFAKGDIMLITGRLGNDDKVICSSLDYYENVSDENAEEKAIAYETIASIGCGKDRREYLLNASQLWQTLGSEFRAKLDKSLAEESKIEFNYSIEGIEPAEIKVAENTTKIIIGSSFFNLTKSDRLLSQADRVTRDWLSYQIYSSPYDNQKLLRTFSERLSYPEEELLPEIGWHEGARIEEIRQIGLKHIVGSGTLAKKINDRWYAPDEKGVFRFEVPRDKILYPTTRFLREDIALIIDTHGVNMLVEQAVRNKATIVVSDCDHPGKVKAAKYLSDKGIKVVCFADKYLPLALGSKIKAIGSPPIKHANNSIIIGSQPISFDIKEKAVVENVSSEKHAISYYETPSIYFSQLERSTGLKLNKITYTLTDFNQSFGLVTTAQLFNASVIAARVFNSNDYYAIKAWLENDKNNRAILFHTEAYPYGYKILKEFPNQTTFDDINPVFE